MIHTKQLTADVTWIYECHEEEEKHVHASQYLIHTNGNYILIDAGMGHMNEFTQIIQTETDGAGIDGLFLTHSILPHTKNLSKIQEEWDDLFVISAAPVPELLGLENAEPRVLNSTEQVFGQEFTFIDPLLTDVVISSWIFDHETGFLFTAEGVGHYHEPGTCAETAETLDGGIEFQNVHQFHEDKLAFLQYVNSEKLSKAFDSVTQRFDIEFVAPIHGNPIEISAFDDYLSQIEQSVDIFEESV